MDVDPFPCERLDVLFGLLMQLIATRFGNPDSPIPSVLDFVFQPWSKEAWNREVSEQESIETIVSIFENMKGVTIVRPPKEEKGETE